MKYKKARTSLLCAGRLPVAASSMGLAACVAFATGCSGGSDHETQAKFSHQTFDEYTEPLSNAIIGTPTGVITIGPGLATDAGVTNIGISGSSTASGGPSVGAGGATSGPTAGSSGSIAKPPGVSGSGTGSGGSVGFSGAIAGSTNGGSGGAAEDASAGFSDGGIFLSDGGPPSPSNVGLWHFDDCSPTSNFLVDSSGLGANAQHALHGSCVPGISGLGVQIRNAKDVVQVPDEPQFTVGSHVAVAAWVFPTTVAGDQPIVIKRLNNQTSFSLGVHKGNVEMSVVLTTGQTIISRAPLPAGSWSHVAGMFDGTFLFLFIDGKQFGQVFAAGEVRNEFAPIRIGATSQSQYFHGKIDEVFVTTDPISAADLTAKSCIQRPSNLTVSPLTSGPVPFDTTVNYDITVANNDIGFCNPGSYSLFFNNFDPNIRTDVSFPPGSFQTVAPSSTGVFKVSVTGNDQADPGVHTESFAVERFDGNFEFLPGSLTYELKQPACFVRTSTELMIKDVSVVDDPVRSPPQSATFVGGDGGLVRSPFGADAGPVSDTGTPSASAGVWTFGSLIRAIAPTSEEAPAMTAKLFANWLTDQTVNGFTVQARPAMQRMLLDIWPRTSTGALDLDRSPLRLQAIVNRIDLRNLANQSAGQGRFVFGVNAAGGFPQEFTLILEYNLPAKTSQDVLDWADSWHGLSAHPFPSEEYNAALEVITKRFASRNASPDSVNGSALLDLRTNEIVLSTDGRWQLREFALSPATKLLEEVTVKETPDLGFNGTTTFADFVKLNRAAIVAQVPGATGIVPEQFDGGSFLAGSIFNDLVRWSAPGLDEEARFHASVDTCNGCHGPETNTTFLMVTPRFPGNEASLSSFLTGTTVFGQNGFPRTLNDLARRRADLTGLVCPASDAGSNDSGSAFDAQPQEASVVDASVVEDAGIVIPPPFPPVSVP